MGTVATIPGLESIDISCTNVSIKGIECLSSLQSLSTLFLNNCPKIDDKAIQYIAATWPFLEGIGLARCDSLTKKALSSLAKLEDLKILDLSYSKDLKSQDFSFINRLTNLEELRIDGYSNPARSWSIFNLPKLRSLSCSESPYYRAFMHPPPKRKGVDRQDTHAHPQLRSLTLDNSRLLIYPLYQDKPLFRCELPHLTHLSLLGCQVLSPVFIATLDLLPNLEHLACSPIIFARGEGTGRESVDTEPELYGADVFPSTLVSLVIAYREGEERNTVKVKGKPLDYAYTRDGRLARRFKLTDAILQNLGEEALTPCTRLASLSLVNHPKITDRGLRYLTKIPSLYTVVIQGCPLVTEDNSVLSPFIMSTG